jgi:hypothetical protein
LRTCVWVCVAIGSLWGRCNNSAHAANVSTSGTCTWMCSGSPSSVGSSLSSVLVSEVTAGVRGRAILNNGDCMTVRFAASSLLPLQLVIRLVFARLPQGRDRLLVLAGQGVIFR